MKKRLTVKLQIGAWKQGWLRAALLVLSVLLGVEGPREVRGAVAEGWPAGIGAKSLETELTITQDWTHGAWSRRLESLMTASSGNLEYSHLQARHGRLFLLKRSQSGRSSVLVMLKDSQDLKTERVILDPGNLSPAGENSIEWFCPSLDGQLVVVAVRRAGEGTCVLNLYDVESGARRGEGLKDVPLAEIAQGVAWLAANVGFYYPRWVAGADGISQLMIYQHKVGSEQETDLVEMNPGVPVRGRIRKLWSSMDGQYCGLAVEREMGEGWVVSVRFPAVGWRGVADVEDQVRSVEFGRDGLYLEYGRDQALYVSSYKNAPKGRVLRAILGRNGIQPWAERVPEYKKTLRHFTPTASGLVLMYQDGVGLESHYQDDFDDKVRVWEVKSAVAVDEMEVVQGDEILFRTQSYLEAPAYLRYDSSEDKDHVKSTVLNSDSVVDYSDVEWVRETGRAADGTRLPMSLLRKRGLREDGKAATLVFVHGAEGGSLPALFSPMYRPWLEQGGILAFAHVRGGGEYGEAWRTSGTGTNRHVAAADLMVLVDLLVSSNYTRPSQIGLVVSGGGSLTVAMAMAQRPELARSVLVMDGLYDPTSVAGTRSAAELREEWGRLEQPEVRAYWDQYAPTKILLPTQQTASWYWVGTMERRPEVMGQSGRMASNWLAGAPGSTRWGVFVDAEYGKGLRDGWGRSGRSFWAKAYTIFAERLGLSVSRIARGPWSGGVSMTSAVVKARLAEPGLGVRLHYSEKPSFEGGQVTAEVRSGTEHYQVVEFPIAHLKASTRYYYALEVEGRMEWSKQGEWVTFPESGPASFKMAFASCARTGSTLETFDRIREEQPLFFLNMGDFHYQNITTNSTQRFVDAYDRVLASPQQADLYRKVPFVYIWDDHDFGGNNSNRKASSHMAARMVYDAYAPHYPLAVANEDSGIYHAFSVGRVRFILTDLRYSRDESKVKDTGQKTMMGIRQKEWFKRELMQANGKYPLICWVSSVPWIGTKGTNYYSFIGTDKYGYFHHTNQLAGGAKEKKGVTPPEEDHWSVYASERQEIADFIKEKGIGGVCILHGDSHMLAADDGSNADFATGGGARIPVMCAGPLDQDASLKGGPYSQGVYRVKKGEGCYGLLSVEDAGSELRVSFSGRNHRNEEKVALKFQVPANP